MAESALEKLIRERAERGRSRVSERASSRRASLSENIARAEEEAEQISPRETIAIAQQPTTRAGRVVRGAIRGVSSVLSPLALPQDILFSTLHGLYDKDTSVWQNFSEMEWGKYTPWTEAPTRVVTGRDLLESMGVQNDKGAQYGGIALDLLVDPLIFGAYVRGAAKVAKAGEAAASMNRLADRLDNVAETVMTLGSTLPTVRSVRTIRGATQSVMQTQAGQAASARALKTYRSLAPEPVRESIQRRVDQIADVAERVRFEVEYVPRFTSERAPRSLRNQSIAGLFGVDMGRDPNLVRQIGQATYEAGKEPFEVGMTVARMLSRMGDERAKGFLNRMLRSQTVHVRDIPKRLQDNELSPDMVDVIYRATYGVADQVSLASGVFSKSERASAGGAGLMAEEARQLMMSRPELRPMRREVLGAQQKLYESEVARVRDVAVRLNQDPNVATTVFKQNVADVVKADARLTYQMSMMPYMRESSLTSPLKWLEDLRNNDPRFARLDDVWTPKQQADWASRIYRDGVSAGLGGPEKYKEFEALRYQLPERVRRAFAPKDDIAPSFRGGRMFAELEALSGLKPQQYFEALLNGHLRRSFGIFNTNSSWEKAVDQLTTPRVRAGTGVIARNIVDENPMLIDALNAADSEATTVARSYMDMMSPRSLESGPRAGRPFGVTVSQKKLKQFMTQQGISPERVDAWFLKFAQMADPQISNMVESVRFMQKEREADKLPFKAREIRGDRTGPVPELEPGGPAVTERRKIDDSFLAGMLESMDPGISLLESAAVTERVVGTQLALKRILDRAAQGPATVRGKEIIWSSKESMPGYHYIGTEQVPQYGNLAGKYVHPILYREINNLMAKAQDPNDFFTAAAALRSMVSGGFLANPATTITNVLGGFYTAFTYGQNPISLANEMLQVRRDFKKYGADLPDLEDVGHLLGDTRSQAEFLQLAPELKARDVSTERDAVQVMRQFGRNLYEGYQEYVIRRPFGVGALGLAPFEMTENLFRVAAYRQAKKKGMSRDEAVDYARFIVFDYGAQPAAVRAARDTGLVLFPSFPYFMMGRTFNALVNRPATLAVAEKMSEAVWNANVPDEDARIALWGGMNDFMRSDEFVPLWQIKDSAGNARGWQFMPLGQIFATNTFNGDVFRDQLQSAGLWGPVYDMFAAAANNGEAVFGARYGKEVYGPSANDAEKLSGFAKFFYNSFAPGFARKLWSPQGENELARGLLPALQRQIVGYEGDSADGIYTLTERFSRAADRGLAAEAFSMFVRTPRAIVATGPGRNIDAALLRGANRTREVLADYGRRIAEAQAMGNEERAAELRLEVARVRAEFEREYGPYREMLNVANSVFGAQP